MDEGDFEWDDAKAAANLAKHGVDFEQAHRAFGDTCAIDFADDRHYYGEERRVRLGMVGSRLLVVAYTLRGNKTRLISAREAEPRERRRYHE